jgi:3-oxoacyl-[acyl-carrier-protein] synthase-3
VVLPHQANIRIIDFAKEKLNIPNDRFYTNLERFGNTSAVGIPLLLDELNRGGKLNNGDIIAMSAFGGGLTSGACIIEWNK